MTRAKRYFPLWVLAVTVFCSMSLRAQLVCAKEGNGTKCTYPGAIGIDNPCDGSLVIVNGTNSVRIREHSGDKGRDREGDRDKPHVNVEMKFVGYGKDASGNAYRTIFVANGEFGAEADNYDMPFHSMWVGNDAPSFSMNGTVRVFAQNTDAVGSSITHFETACRAGDHDNDGDHDDSH
jgi:hypothetical protein